MRAFRWRFPITQYYHHHPLILQGGAPFLACFGGGENEQKKKNGKGSVIYEVTAGAVCEAVWSVPARTQS